MGLGRGGGGLLRDRVGDQDSQLPTEVLGESGRVYESWQYGAEGLDPGRG